MNYRNTAQSLRSHVEPLSNVELERYAPSIFATQPWHQMSDKYAFLPTVDVIEGLRREGFLPVHAIQSRTRVPGKGDFTKHQIRFRDFRSGNVPAIRTLGTLYPEIVLTNSHDGASAYVLEAGLWRLVCLNGMVVSDALLGSLRVKHQGNVGDVISISHEIVEQFPKVLDSVERFQALRLEAPEQRAFAAAALTLRYDEGQAPVTPEQVIAPRRREDAEPTLWNTFNVVQEALVQGGDRYRTPDQPATAETAYRPARRMRTRPVQGIAENTKLNKALWTLAEEMHKLRG
jgi:hypothetical protein